MSRVIIFPYKNASVSAKALKLALRDRDQSCYRINDTVSGVGAMSVLLNWGCSNPKKLVVAKTNDKPYTEYYPDKEVNFNKPICVDIAACKMSSMNMFKLKGVTTPQFWKPEELAIEEFSDNTLFVGRKLLRASSGKGIVLFKASDGIPSGVKLVTQYIKKAEEYRVHVVRGKVIDIQQKRISTSYDGEVNHQIRNHCNGWVFCKEDVKPHERVIKEALKAVEALMLDFGAVDVIWNNHYKVAYVLEVNTAPGLEGSTVDSYADAFVKEMSNA